VEVAEEADELLLVLGEDVEDGLGLVGVGHEHLEDVEGLELDVFALVPQEVHHQLQVLLVTNVLGHHIEVGPVQQQLPQQLPTHTHTHNTHMTHTQDTHTHTHT
jgi:hypothetical protein